MTEIGAVVLSRRYMMVRSEKWVKRDRKVVWSPTEVRESSRNFSHFEKKTSGRVELNLFADGCNLSNARKREVLVT